MRYEPGTQPEKPDFAYGKTQQFRDLILRCRKLGIPKMKFRGTVKIHGTNAGVRFEPVPGHEGVYSTPDSYSMTAMSRKNDLDVDIKSGRHMGFAQFVEDNENDLRWINEQFRGRDYGVGFGETLCIYGEWVGKGILKGAAIQKMETKRWIIFAASVTNGDDQRWLDVEKLNAGMNDRIRSIFDFKLFDVEVCFTNPEIARDEMEKITLAIGDQCPVALEFGCDGIGEGVVWTNLDAEGYKTMFKTKDGRHRKEGSEPKVVIDIEPQMLEDIQQFVSYAVTQERVDQAMDSVQAVDRSFTGKVLQFVARDIMAEEADVLEKSGLTWKDVANGCNAYARKMFFNKLDVV